MSAIEKFTGQPCPDCASRLSDPAGSTRWFGTTTVRRRCRHCGRVFTLLPEPASDKPATYDANPIRCRCPRCNAGNPPVQSTITREDGTRMRKHRCSACDHRFVSFET